MLNAICIGISSKKCRKVVLGRRGSKAKDNVCAVCTQFNKNSSSTVHELVLVVRRWSGIDTLPELPPQAFVCRFPIVKKIKQGLTSFESSFITLLTRDWDFSPHPTGRISKWFSKETILLLYAKQMWIFTIVKNQYTYILRWDLSQTLPKFILSLLGIIPH